jgi:hypothetical protein
VGEFKDGKRSGKGKMAYSLYNSKFRINETAEYEGDWRFNFR